jgi:hypothetical protein
MSRITEPFVREFAPWVLRALTFLAVCGSALT